MVCTLQPGLVGASEALEVVERLKGCGIKMITVPLNAATRKHARQATASQLASACEAMMCVHMLCAAPKYAKIMQPPEGLVSHTWKPFQTRLLYGLQLHCPLRV